MADDLTFGALTVCMRHYRFVPCRRCDEPTPKFWSTEPADIDLVRRLQQQEEFVADDIVTRLRELLDGPVPMTVERQDIRDATAEIERLTEWRKNALLALDKREAEIGRLRQRNIELEQQLKYWEGVASAGA